MAVPFTMKALVEKDDMTGAEVTTVPLPELEANDVLVKVEYVEQNPSDGKHAEQISLPGMILGCDYVGIVVALGPHVPNTSIQIGDRIAGCILGGMFKSEGAFAEYLRVQSDLAFHVPKRLPIEQAPTWGIPWVTALHALILSQKHPWPPAEQSGWYLIYGGSTGVGCFAIQIAKLLGYKVIATASPHSFDLIKSYGADETVDYHDGDAAVKEIKRITGGGVSIGLDAIAQGASFDITARSFGTSGGRLNIMLPASEEQQAVRPDVEFVFTLMYTLFGNEFNFTPRKEQPVIYPFSQEDRDFYVEVNKRTPDYFTKYGIRSPPIELRGGLHDINAGFKDMKAGKVSGKRLVYKIDQ